MNVDPNFPRPLPQRLIPRPSELAHLSPEARIRHEKTVAFLSALTKDGYVSDTRYTENEGLTESCWFSCKSSNEDRRARREPECKAICWIRTKPKQDEESNAASGLHEDLQTDQDVALFKKPEAYNIKATPTDERYRFGFLQGRYIYRAHGSYALAKHASPDLTVEALHQLEELQAKEQPKTITRAERMGLVKRAPVAPLTHYERLYPLCTIVSTRLERFHNHLVRIYSPAFRAVVRIPDMLSDGTYIRISKEIWDRGLSGDGLLLGKKLIDVGTENAKKWWEKGSSGGFGGGPFGGLGGSPPPPAASGPPPTPPVPSPGAPAA